MAASADRLNSRPSLRTVTGAALTSSSSGSGRCPRVGYLIDQIDMQGQNRELIDELVSLSTRYGILTPYTSFLADERVQLHAAMGNAVRARQSLQDLNAVSGEFGVAQPGEAVVHACRESG